MAENLTNVPLVLVNKYPPIQCLNYKIARNYILFLKELRNGTLKQIKICKACRRRASTAIRATRAARLPRPVLRELDPNRELHPKGGILDPSLPPPSIPPPPPIPPPGPGRQYTDSETEDDLPMVAAGTR